VLVVVAAQQPVLDVVQRVGQAGHAHPLALEEALDPVHVLARRRLERRPQRAGVVDVEPEAERAGDRGAARVERVQPRERPSERLALGGPAQRGVIAGRALGIEMALARDLQRPGQSQRR
jgi:hypothetical protein